MRKVTGLYIILGICLSGFTQKPASVDAKGQPYLQFNLHTGSFWSRSEYLVEQFNDPYKAMEFRFGYQLTGNKPWHQVHRFPKVGFGMHYSDLVKDKSDTVVGNPISLFGFYSAPWLRFGRYTLANDLSAGLSYMGLVYDPESNPFNDVIASHINLYFEFNLNLNVSVTPRLGLNLGYGVTHYSNGRIKSPQKGVNNWGWTFGLDYKLTGALPEFVYRDPPPFKSTEAIELMYAVGTVEEVDLRDNEAFRYFTSSFTADYVCTLNQKSAVTFGLDVFYDGSLERAIKGVPPEYITSWEKTYLASHLGYHFMIDRFTLLFNMGTYFRQHTYDRGYYYIRAGSRYQITDHLSGHLCIKSKNGMRSDWVEWGCAYSLKI
jgi:hypothetical protein